MTGFTENYGFELPDFDSSSWHEPMNRTITQIDTLLKVGTGLPVVKGAWLNSLAYVINDRVLDPVDASLWICAVNHTTPATGTFSEARASNPTYWVNVGTGWSARGEWNNSTEYIVGDVAYDSSDYLYAVCIDAHASPASGTLRNDIANWDVIFDGLATVTDAVAAKDAAVVAKNAAEDAKNAAVVAQLAAELAESNAETAETNALLAQAGAEDARDAAQLAEANAVNVVSDGVSGAIRTDAVQTLTSAQRGRAWTNIGGSRENDDLIINGAFDVAQRGTSLVLNSTTGYLLDRWNVGAGSGGACTVTQDQHVVSGQYSDFYMRINQTVGGVFPFFSQKIENVRSYAGQTITVFLRASCAVALPVQVIVRQFFGTGGSPSSLVDTVVGTLNVGAIGWHSINVDVPDILGKLLGTNNNDYFEVIFRLPDGTTFELNVVNVFIKRGVVPVEAANYYSPPPIWETEPTCRRFYEKGSTDCAGVTHSGNGDTRGSVVNYTVSKRVTPVVSFSSTSISIFAVGANGAAPNLGGDIVSTRRDVNGWSIAGLGNYVAISAAIGGGDFAWGLANGPTYYADAEL